MLIEVITEALNKDEVGTVSLPSWHLYSPGGADNHQRSKNIILSGDGPYGGKWCGMKE